MENIKFKKKEGYKYLESTITKEIQINWYFTIILLDLFKMLSHVQLKREVKFPEFTMKTEYRLSVQTYL